LDLMSENFLLSYSIQHPRSCGSTTGETACKSSCGKILSEIGIDKARQCALSLSLFVIKGHKAQQQQTALAFRRQRPSGFRPALIAAPGTKSTNAAPCSAAQRKRNRAQQPAAPAAQLQQRDGNVVLPMRIAATKTAREVPACSL
jgi:hypothetical protein